jgi:Glycosyl hydrolase family 30 TIM-barrel domain
MMRLLFVPAALFTAVSLWTRPACAIDFPSTAACPNPVELDFGVGCMCTTDSCGIYPVDPTPPSLMEALVITTSPKDGFLSHQPVFVDNDFGDSSNSIMMNITVNPDVTFQDILGFGAAITDAVSYALTEVLKGDGTLVDIILKQAFVHANFSMARVNMNGCDFSRMDYALSHELDLSDFCLRDDRTPDREEVTCGEDYKLEVLERIIALQPGLKVLVSSWSASPTFKHQNFTCDLHHHVIECQPDENAQAQVECVRTVTDPNTCGGQPQGVPCSTTPPANYSQGFPLSNSFDEKYNPLNIPSKNADGNCYNAGFLREDAYASWAGLYAKFIEGKFPTATKSVGCTPTTLTFCSPYPNSVRESFGANLGHHLTERAVDADGIVAV